VLWVTALNDSPVGGNRRGGIEQSFIGGLAKVQSLNHLYKFNSFSYGVIVRARAALKRTVVGDQRPDNPSGSHPQSQVNSVFPFLNCLVSHDNNELRTTVYRKLTHTNRLPDKSSYNPTSHKATTIKTLTRRAQLVGDTLDSLCDENRYLERVFHKNNYNADFFRRHIYRPTEADATNRNPTPVTTVTIPYIKGTSETISQILQP